jgi:hypothetical protein
MLVALAVEFCRKRPPMIMSASVLSTSRSADALAAGVAVARVPDGGGEMASRRLYAQNLG